LRSFASVEVPRQAALRPGPPPTQPVKWYPAGAPYFDPQPVPDTAAFFPQPEAAAPEAEAPEPVRPEARWVRVLRYAAAAGIVIAAIWFLFSGTNRTEGEGFENGFEGEGRFDWRPESRWILHPPPD
jgi:hypothetical protein